MTRLLILLVLLSTSLMAQLPVFENKVLDHEKSPRLINNFRIAHFLPAGDENAFFFTPDYGNPILYFTGTALDTVAVDATINGRVYDRYAGGYFLYTNDGTRESTVTYSVDTVTYDTTYLHNDVLNVKHIFSDGRTLLESGSYLFVIGEDPSSLQPLETYINDYYRSSGSAVGNYFVFEGEYATYSTDGTVAGTRKLVKGYGDDYITVGDRVYFNDWSNDSLYVSDGTPEGTATVSYNHLPADARPNYYHSKPFMLAAGTAFIANSPASGSYLWIRDGESRFQSVVPIAEEEWISNDSVLLYRPRPDQGRGLWITDGNISGTRQLVPPTANEAAVKTQGPELRAKLSGGDLLFDLFRDGEPALWHYSARTGTATPVSLPRHKYSSDLTYLPVGNKLYLLIDRGDSGLFEYDPVAKAFSKLAAFVSASGGVMKLAGDGILIHADDGEYDGRRWTVIRYRNETTIYEGHLGVQLNAANLTPDNLALRQVGDKLYGISIDPGAGEAIISVDLLSQRTEVIHDLYLPTLSSKPYNLMAGEGAAFFGIDGDLYGSPRGVEYERLLAGEDDFYALPLPGTGTTILVPRGSSVNWYFSDGRKSGTKSIGKPALYPLSKPVVQNGNAYYITTDDRGPVNGGAIMLMRVDGKSGAFTEVYRTAYTTFSGLAYGAIIATTGTELYFPLPGANGKLELWRSNGQQSGTTKVAEIGKNFEKPVLYDLTSGNGMVTYHFGEFNNSNSIHEHYLVRDGDSEPYLHTTTDRYSNPLPVRVGDRILIPRLNGIVSLSRAGGQPVSVYDCTECYPSSLVAVDDTSVVFVAREGFDQQDLHRMNVSGANHSVLLTAVSPRYNPPLSLLDSMLLIDREWMGDASTYEEIVLVNVRSGAYALATPDSGLHQVSDIVALGNRFAYIDEDDVYGKEVFIVNFPDYPEITVGGSDGPVHEPLTLTVYPNPTHGTINLQLPPDGEFHYSLYDNQGRLVKVGRVASGLAVIDLPPGIRPGPYYLRVIDRGSQRYGVQRIVVH